MAVQYTPRVIVYVTYREIIYLLGLRTASAEANPLHHLTDLVATLLAFVQDILFSSKQKKKVLNSHVVEITLVCIMSDKGTKGRIFISTYHLSCNRIVHQYLMHVPKGGNLFTKSRKAADEKEFDVSLAEYQPRSITF
jgi:hypothetical protein